MTVTFTPGRNMIATFEELQKKHIGKVTANSDDQEFCRINSKCDRYFTSADIDASNICDFMDIRNIDGNWEDVSFGDLFVHHVWDDPVYKQFAGHIWYEQDKKQVDPIAIDSDLANVIESSYAKCSDDGLSPVERFISMVAKGELSKADADAMIAKVDQLEAKEAAWNLVQIRDGTYSPATLADCGKAGAAALRKVLDLDSTCGGPYDKKFNLDSKAKLAAVSALGTIVLRGETSALPTLLDAIESVDKVSNSLNAVEHALTYGDVKDGELRKRAESLLRYYGRRYENGVESCWSNEKAEQARKKAEEVAEKERKAFDERAVEQKRVFDLAPAGDAGPRVGALYMSDTKAFGGDTKNLGGISYDFVGRFMLGIEDKIIDGNGDLVSGNSYYIGAQAGLGGISVWKEGEDGATVGNFTAGLVFEAYPGCDSGDCFVDHEHLGVRLYLGYAMPFQKEVLNHGIQGELQVDFDTGITLGPVMQYYPETSTWSLGAMLGLEFVDVVEQ